MWGYEGIVQMIVDMFYIDIFILAIVGSVLFSRSARKDLAFWWVSVMANIFAFLYFLGGFGLFAFIIQAFSFFIWPIINIGLLLYLIVRINKKKKESRANNEPEIKKLKKNIVILAIVVFCIAMSFLLGFMVFTHWLTDGT